MKINFEDTPLNFASKNEILELVIRGYVTNEEMSSIVSLNPETVMLALWNKPFKEAVAKARYVIADGIGVSLAVRFLFGKTVPRVTGVDLMEYLLRAPYKNSLTVCLIGGKSEIADKLNECYSQGNPHFKIYSLIGYADIFHPKKEEEDEVNRIVRLHKPRLVFASFGSPQQELWIERQRNLFRGSVVIGVGGAFDFLSRRVPRAPRMLQKIGLEWLFRLAVQPRRIMRQWRLFVFFLYVLLYKMRQLLTYFLEK